MPPAAFQTAAVRAAWLARIVWLEGAPETPPNVDRARIGRLQLENGRSARATPSLREARLSARALASHAAAALSVERDGFGRAIAHSEAAEIARHGPCDCSAERARTEAIDHLATKPAVSSMFPPNRPTARTTPQPRGRPGDLPLGRIPG